MGKSNNKINYGSACNERRLIDKEERIYLGQVKFEKRDKDTGVQTPFFIFFLLI